MNRKYGLDDICKIEGSITDIISVYGNDSCCPAICRYCGAIDFREHDCYNGICHECGKQKAVDSAFILMGII